MRLKILGPPGTGKTTTILSYIKQFQEDETIQRILCCAFTVAAKNEAKRRCDSHAKTTFATIHGELFEHMKYSRRYMINTLQCFAKSLGQSCAMAHDQHILSAKTPVEQAIAYYQLSRSRMVALGALPLPPGLSLQTIDAYAQEFEHYKFRESLLDYNDVLANYLTRGETLTYDAVMVDEAQDLSRLQWACVDKMFRSAKYYYTVGDDDQSIYSFAGTDAEDFIHWPTEKTIVLNHSYRLGKNILDYSKTVLHRIKTRMHKEYIPRSGPSTVTFVNDVTPNFDCVAPITTAILHRNSYLGNRIRALLHEQGVTYVGKGSPFSLKSPLKAIRFWEAWRSGTPLLGNALTTIFSYIPDTADFDKAPYQQIGRRAQAPPCPCPTVPWQQILEVPFKTVYMRVQDTHGLAYLLASPTLTVTTIHQSKGGEWDKVILMTDVSAATYHQLIHGSEKQQDEEHRVWYVALTRAKHELQIVRPQTTKYYPMEEPA